MTGTVEAFNDPSLWKIPTSVELSDITIRDGFQSLETIVSTADKVSFLEDLILAGYKRVEVSNYAHPKLVPFFNDIDDVFKGLLNSEKVGHLLKQNVSDDNRENGNFVELTAITITRRGAERAFEAFQKGYGPDRILQMVSTDPTHHKRNSGMELEDYWAMSEECIRQAHELGIKVNGTVSTIWGSPYKDFEPSLDRAIEFVKRYLDIGADDIEHADHDGSLTRPEDAYEYFSMLTDARIMGEGPDGRDYSNPELHVAHFHTKNMQTGLQNVVAALRAGIIRYESTMSGIGGEPANKVDGIPIEGRPEYYSDHFNHGLVSTEDVVTLMNLMGIDNGIDVAKLMTVSGRIKNLLEKFNNGQRSREMEIMPCRSYMMTQGILPEKVLQLAGIRTSSK